MGSEIGGAFAPASLAESETCMQEEMLARVGQITRSLHNNLRELGLDKIIQDATHQIPNARDRLAYVARMTEQAAQKVLNATEAAMPLQDGIEEGAVALAAEWSGVMAGNEAEQSERLAPMADRTLAFLERTRSDSGVTRQHLLDIMMAQDFQDLTGQVIKKITELTYDLEQQLVQLLVDFAPQESRREPANGSMLNGPQIHADANGETVVSNQEQVDDLLSSLGF